MLLCDYTVFSVSELIKEELVPYYLVLGQLVYSGALIVTIATT